MMREDEKLVFEDQFDPNFRENEKKNEKIIDNVKDSKIRMGLLLSTFGEEISISEKMELIQNMMTELRYVRGLLQGLEESK